MKSNKIRVAVMFGGKSPEHEVSVITGLQVLENIDRSKFDVIPIYVSKEGYLYAGTLLGSISTYKNLQNIATQAKKLNFSNTPLHKGFVYSIDSLMDVLKGIPKYLDIDVIFPAFHGGIGENGGFSGLYEALDVPYVGPGIIGGSLGMDKVLMKKVFEQAKVPITKWLWFYRDDWKSHSKDILKKAETTLTFPLFIKPANGGSSIGTSKVNNKKELMNAIEVASFFDNKIIIEESFENAREINISVMGNAGSELLVSKCEEVFSSSGILTYEDKYMGNSKNSPPKGMAQTKRIIPANIPKVVEQKIQETSKLIFNTIDGSGVSRIDFLFRESTNEIKALEINTIPGSLSFYLWESSHIPFKALITRLIDLAIEKYNEKQKNSVAFSSNILENLDLKGSKSK
ncbi:D-alanine--D-alanine ligase [Candidatus Roizmanbacteria bacterium]|nr:D-alanine--D-alanine ligase [Candidatus Roizmanbacteria bacterium]